MLDDTLKAQLQAYLQRVTQPFELVASLANPDAPTETDMQVKQLLTDIVEASGGKIGARFDGTNARKPSFNLVRSQRWCRTQPDVCRFATGP
jgi:alkyl hydroperoxide reductase subunit F